jgi:uncharacterized protein (DUF433 family)
MPETTVPLGVGIYTRAEAARLIGVTQTRLRRWVGGYTYWYKHQSVESLRRRPAVVKPKLPILGGAVALSFVELMELRVVKALIDKGISLQHVRAAAGLAARHFDTSYPFASRRVFTDGRRVFASLARDPSVADMVELSRDAVDQIIAGGVFEPFLEEIDFDATTALAERWWPLGRSVPVVLDPRIAFGAPVVVGTRIRTNVLAGMASRTGPDETARAYRVSVEGVRAAVRFEQQLAAA